MSKRADTTLAAIVANLAACGTRWQFWPADVAPRQAVSGRCLTSDTVQRRLRDAGYAVPATNGWWELTEAGLGAVEAVRSARCEAPTAPASPCVGTCGLDPHTGWCRGCARTGPEIAAWPTMADAGKRAVLQRAAGRRQGASGGVARVGTHGGTPGVGMGLSGPQIGGSG